MMVLTRVVPRIVLVTALGIALWSCGGSNDGGTKPDTTPPAAVVDLSVTAVTASTVTLRWTAPGDDGAVGTASAYEIRRATFAVTSGNWASATLVGDVPDPHPAGTTETHVVSGLVPDTIYFFAMKTRDDADNWSALSNTASDTTAGGVTPEDPVLTLSTGRLDFGAHLTDLGLVVTNSGTGTLIWTAAGDRAWMSVGPAGGSTTTESDTVHVLVDRSGLEPGDHTGSVTVTPEGGDPQEVEVSVHVEAPPVIVVTVSPDTVDVETGSTRQFAATVTGTTDQTVTWSVDEGAAWGTVDEMGLYTAPAVVPSPATATVRATSVTDPARSASSSVRIIVPTPAGYARVPAGSFEMGGDPQVACGGTPYQVALTEDFFLGQTEVTNQQYLEMVQWAYDQGHVTAGEDSVRDAASGRLLLELGSPLCEIAFSEGTFSIRNAGHGPYNSDHPVLEVTWYGAAAYCDWLSLKDGFAPAYDHTSWTCNGGDPYRAQGYRLPTDAEWEYAARFDDERVFPWGDNLPTCLIANFAVCTSNWTDAVTLRAPQNTINGRGLHDLGGNVWEWCNDWFQCEAYPSSEDPPGPGFGTNKVIRGGAWSTYDFLLRCAHRSGASPTISNVIYGFRVARTCDP